MLTGKFKQLLEQIKKWDNRKTSLQINLEANKNVIKEE
jgi:hypothetical protein